MSSTQSLLAGPVIAVPTTLHARVSSHECEPVAVAVVCVQPALASAYTVGVPALAAHANGFVLQSIPIVQREDRLTHLDAPIVVKLADVSGLLAVVRVDLLHQVVWPDYEVEAARAGVISEYGPRFIFFLDAIFQLIGAKRVANWGKLILAGAGAPARSPDVTVANVVCLVSTGRWLEVAVLQTPAVAATTVSIVHYDLVTIPALPQAVIEVLVLSLPVTPVPGLVGVFAKFARALCWLDVAAASARVSVG
mmetsp:Transcript_18766/g.48132  ORF Transcript_18766/g.48132 Transcript_18766/m.48132 type:complete len:251 (-) Transcript_18766:742-1494(-)